MYLLLQDTLMDLLLPDSMRRNATGAGAGRNEMQLPRLDIKKDPKGLVTVVGATDLSVTSEQQLLTAIEQVRGRRGRDARFRCAHGNRLKLCLVVQGCTWRHQQLALLMS
jgi:hypothetical protein